MGLTVLSVAYPLTEVGEDAVGGSEQVLTLLDRALTEAGHQSLVVAAEGSLIRGTLIPSPRARGKLNDQLRRGAQQIHKQLILATLKKYPVDLVHMHSLDFHRYVPGPEVPTLATLHLPPDWYSRNIFRLKRRNLFLNCVSVSQHKACPQSSLLLPSIPNGVDVRRFEGRSVKRNYALALGRICPEKGFHFALDAAGAARTELLLAGEIFPYASHRDYFKKQIAPRLNDERQFLGPVGFARKKQLLREAKCLLIPSTVAETSSLVAMEALASGTPVIAFRSGALPEIVEHGRTGYLVSNTKEMAQAISAAGKLDPEECREAARRRFSADTMIARYAQLYHRIVAGKTSEEAQEVRIRPGASWLVSW